MSAAQTIRILSLGAGVQSTTIARITVSRSEP